MIKDSVKEILKANSDDRFPRDSLLFCPSETVETLQNIMINNTAESGYTRLSRYAHLRESAIDLDAVSLTDKQLIAVSMIFYAKVKKTRAAEAMNISKQSIDDIVINALKKIEEYMTQ